MKKWLLFLLALNFFLSPRPVFAHAFGQLYNLPIPFWMYLYGGAGALIVSFIIIGFFLNKTNYNFSYPTKNISKNPFIRFISNNSFVIVVRIFSVFLFLLTITTGIFGQDDSFLNFNMTFFWIIFLLGLTYLTAFIGNLYTLINPWKIVTEWFENVLGQEAKGFISYPKKLSYYPAFLFYVLFIWIELHAQTTPLKLSIILIQYSLMNALGVMFIGKKSWFTYCEFFSVFFTLISKIAPIENRGGNLYLRPPFVGLIRETATDFSLLFFILFMLSSTAFDGFSSTTPWVRFSFGFLQPRVGDAFGDSYYSVITTAGLFLSPFVFLFIYFVLMGLAKIFTNSKDSIGKLSGSFAYSLLPIALVYNMAHYYTLILTEGQRIISLISDPFGFGWNLFGTADNGLSLNIVDANITWHSQVALILFGHIVAVYVAHVIALHVFSSHKKALVSQFPMLVLMVAYTMIGLWILSLPITSKV